MPTKTKESVKTIATIDPKTRRWVEEPNPAVDEVVARVIEVTPSMAAQILAERNVNNRTMKRRRISEYTRAIRHGDWEPLASMVGFRYDGTLNDGQNRLQAIINADKPQKMLMVFGQSEQAQLVTDIGTRRSLFDSCMLRQVDMPKDHRHFVASSVTYLLDQVLYPYEKRRNRTEKIRFLEEHLDYLEKAARLLNPDINDKERIIKGRISSIFGAVIGSALYEHRDNPHKTALIERFCLFLLFGNIAQISVHIPDDMYHRPAFEEVDNPFEAYTSWQDIEPYTDADSGAVLLRNYIITQRGHYNRNGSNRKIAFKKAVRALEFFLNRETAGKLHEWKDDYPYIVPMPVHDDE